MTRDEHGEVVALDQFHHERVDVRRLILFDDAVDLGYVRVVERCQRLRFTREPGDALRIVREDVWQDFDPDVAIQLGISGAIHLAHSAFAQLAEDLIRAEGISGLHHSLT